MCALFQNRYRIESIRKPGHDYGGNGFYFITICTRHRRPYFGTLRHQRLERSTIGCVAEECWHGIPKHFPFVRVDAFVLMPDHLHGILCFNKPPGEATGPVAHPEANRFGPQSANLASVIRGYKSAVTAHARKNGIAFDWQSRYHDRIISSPDHLAAARRYIDNNPRKSP